MKSKVMGNIVIAPARDKYIISYFNYRILYSLLINLYIKFSRDVKVINKIFRCIRRIARFLIGATDIVTFVIARGLRDFLITLSFHAPSGGTQVNEHGNVVTCVKN